MLETLPSGLDVERFVEIYVVVGAQLGFGALTGYTAWHLARLKGWITDPEEEGDTP